MSHKNLILAHLLTYKQTANQALYEDSSKIVLDSQLQKKLASLKQQVLEAKKAALKKQLQTLISVSIRMLAEEPAANRVRAKISNLGLFYEHESEDSHLRSLCANIAQLIFSIFKTSRKINSSRKTL